jgi:outer membrane receptor protein involved in Fe transport
MKGLRFATFVSALLVVAIAAPVLAQTVVTGSVRDETGGALPGVTVEVRDAGPGRATVTDAAGAYRFDAIAPGKHEIVFTLVNFATVRRTLAASGPSSAAARIDVVMHLSLSADVTVTGKRTFANLADAERPAEDLVGIAQSASQGAITARQLDARPIMRNGEVFETVPGVIVSQHSGEGKANQYYLRGFNLDHGTDFATTIAGMPVNLPTHGHGHGYSDVNFMIPELVSGVQFSKGPYFADQGDFATAGAVNINYVTQLDRPIVRVGGGDEGFARVLVAASPAIGRGHVLAAFDLQHNDGPWTTPENFRKYNAVVRYSHGDSVNGFSLTGMAYQGSWTATDQVPLRAIEEGLISRFGNIDPTDGGDSSRFSASAEWQRTRGQGVTKVTAFGFASNLNLYSNFTFFLDDPTNGDQSHQSDRRFVSGAKVTHRRLGKWGGHDTQTSWGALVRNDSIPEIGLAHTRQRQLLETLRTDAVVQSSGGVFAQNETSWTPWLRSIAGLRADGYRFAVNGAAATYDGLASPKGGLIVGPWRGTEMYANAGLGFHSNDARSGANPLARATGAEVGFRTVAIPHLQSSLAVWSLSLDSELIFVGDAGTTKAGRPSHRQGLEWANYYAPHPWLIVDGDLSWSTARFTDSDPAGNHIPGSIETAASAGVTIDSLHNVFGSIRARYFGPRPLIEDDSVRSKATSLVNLEAGYKFSKRVRVSVDLFNVLDAEDSDIDYYYVSRLRGEPAEGVDDIHLHPSLPRSARLALSLAF